MAAKGVDFVGTSKGGDHEPTLSTRAKAHHCGSGMFGCLSVATATDQTALTSEQIKQFLTTAKIVGSKQFPRVLLGLRDLR